MVVVSNGSDATNNKARDKSTTIQHSSRARHAKGKPKMTKEERRAKYTEIARKRRQKEQGFRNNNKGKSNQLVCYRCRQPGHTIANCTASEQQQKDTSHNTIEGGTLCYKCGSTEHTLSNCSKAKKSGGRNSSSSSSNNENDDDDLPFATCFLCKEKGHLVSKCPQNNRGIYVNGGCCRLCGSQQHRATSCPEKKSKQRDNHQDESDDVSHLLEESHPRDVPKEKSTTPEPRKRVVKF